MVSICRPDKTVLNQECDWLISGAGQQFLAFTSIRGSFFTALRGIKVKCRCRWKPCRSYWQRLLWHPGLAQVAGVSLSRHFTGTAFTVLFIVDNSNSDKVLAYAFNRKADHVTTFIREAIWISATPGMGCRKYTDEEREEFVLHSDKLTELRKASEKAIGEIFPVLFDGSAAHKQLEGFIKDRMIEKLNNRDLERPLIPDFAFGCRRITVSLLSSL